MLSHFPLHIYIFVYFNIVQHHLESKSMTVYILSPPSIYRDSFSGQNCDGVLTSKTDNTSNAVINLSDAISQRLDIYILLLFFLCYLLSPSTFHICVLCLLLNIFFNNFTYTYIFNFRGRFIQ